jgi:hypothetical protein
LVALLVVLALVAALGVVRLRDTGPPEADLSWAKPPPAPQPTPIELEIERLSRWVEAERELAFKRPPRVDLHTDETFEMLYRSAAPLTEEDREQIETMASMLKAVGLLDADVDVLARGADAIDNVLGFYDPRSGQLVVRGALLTPHSRSVLVHELTHALDDQHFGLHRPEMADGRFEDAAAFQALVEGDATRVQLAYIDSLPEAERAAVIEAETDGFDEAVAANTDPQAMDYFGAFPYRDGARFVESLVEAGGNAAVDRAFADPPRTTAAIIVPDRFLHGLDGIRLPLPRPDGEVVDEGMFGALALYLVLATVVPSESAAIAAVSWEGDSYMAWRTQDGRTCVKLRFVLATPWQADFTAMVLDEWASRQIDANVEAPGTVLVESCR